MFEARKLEASLEGLEIGATAPQKLQVVLQAGRHSVTLKLTAGEANWLASALNHWAEKSTLINLN
jgi:hypothetical protein